MAETVEIIRSQMQTRNYGSQDKSDYQHQSNSTDYTAVTDHESNNINCSNTESEVQEKDIIAKVYNY